MPTLGNYTFTTNAHGILSRALVELGTPDTSFLNTGNSNLSETAMKVLFINEAEREVYQRHPRLNLAEATVSVTADTKTASIPSGAWRAGSIDGIFFSDSEDIDHMQEIRLVDRSVAERQSGYRRNDATNRIPSYAWLDFDSNVITFAENVSETTDFIVRYRAKAGLFTSNDLASNSVVYSVIPNEHIETVALLLASKFARLLDLDRKVIDLFSRFERADDLLSDAITYQPAVSRNMTLDNENAIKSAPVHTSSGLGALSFGHFRRL